MPSRMWPVNQPSLLIGYQFCSRPGYVVTPPAVAAGTGMRAAISGSNQDHGGVHCPFRAYLVCPRVSLGAAGAAGCLHRFKLPATGIAATSRGGPVVARSTRRG